MEEMTFQPAAGAHGEFLGILLIKRYHESRKDCARKKIIVPDSAHGTNPATASMAGFTVVNIPSAPDGTVDLAALRAAAGADTAGLMLTNPNTLGIFDKNIEAITDIVHGAGGLCYYRNLADAQRTGQPHGSKRNQCTCIFHRVGMPSPSGGCADCHPQRLSCRIATRTAAGA